VSLSGTFVETSAGRVFVHRPNPGRGRPLVLLHGFMMSHFYFRDLLPALSAIYDVVALDLPGFGESDRPAPDRFAYDLPAFARVTAEVMTALSIDRAAVLGHSMGGGVALTLAARHPEKVERLVLMAAAIYPLPLPRIGKLLLGPGGPLLWRYGLSRAILKREMRREHVKDPAPITDEFIDYFYARLCRPGGRASAYAALKALGALTSETSDPGRVRAPTLLVWADEDRMVPLGLGRRLERAIAGARLAIIPDAGPIFHLERPDELLRQLLPFLRDETLRPIAETPVPPARSQGLGGLKAAS
jgi:pimeloyl-ACP methyl ester carboxylesterase